MQRIRCTTPHIQVRIDENVSDAHKVLFQLSLAREHPVLPDSNSAGHDRPRRVVSGFHHSLPPDRLDIHHFSNYGEYAEHRLQQDEQHQRHPAALQASSGSFSWAERLGHDEYNGYRCAPVPKCRNGREHTRSGYGNQDDLIDNGLRFNEQLSWVRGRHTSRLRCGCKDPIVLAVQSGNDAGVYNFARSQTAASQTFSANTGNGIASFLLGDLEASRQVTGHVARWTQQYYAGFVKDD